MKKQAYLLLAIMVLAALAGWGAAVARFALKKPAPVMANVSSPDRMPKEEPNWTDQHVGDLHYADLIQATGKFDLIIVWEGLPHQFETASRAREQATKKTFQIGDQYFYAQPLILTDEERTAVSAAVLKDKQNFIPWRGEKLCGGFHADYAIEWRSKGAVLAQALICFSCEEAQFRVGARVERVDLSEEGNRQFHALLSSHRQERPAFQLAISAKSESPAGRPGGQKMDMPESARLPIAPPPISKIDIAPPMRTPLSEAK